MSTIVTADIHLTDNPRDAYRWGLFPWLLEEAKKLNLGWVDFVILGDLTDAKDRHSAVLVNRLVNALHSLRDISNSIYILKGNHDYVDPNTPFFGFLDRLNRVQYISNPASAILSAVNSSYFFPSTKDWKSWENIPMLPKATVFTHATFDGCFSENGTKLSGVPPSIFRKHKGKVWSGDIHTPQTVGKNIEYVGAPYRIDFGDRYTPRCLVLGHGGTIVTELHYPCPNKHLLVGSDLRAIQQQAKVQRVKAGDQVKVRVALARAEYVDWPKLRQAIRDHAEQHEWELYGPELRSVAVVAPKSKPVVVKRDRKSILKNWATSQTLSPKVTKVGLSVLDEAE